MGSLELCGKYNVYIFICLVVLTILRNISQWEGLSHIYIYVNKKRADYRGGWSGESIDFAAFFRYGNGLHMKPQITTVQNTTFSAEMLSLSKDALFFA